MNDTGNQVKHENDLEPTAHQILWFLASQGKVEIETSLSRGCILKIDATGDTEHHGEFLPDAALAAMRATGDYDAVREENRIMSMSREQVQSELSDAGIDMGPAQAELARRLKELGSKWLPPQKRGTCDTPGCQPSMGVCIYSRCVWDTGNQEAES